MPLSEVQEAFMAQILDEDAPLPQAWGERHARGIAVYRNNYRSALIEVMRATYERTARWVGEEAFRRAAAHHLIAHPPKHWTIDLAGEGFDSTCAELFADDPEVAELAWLEWTMGQAFIAADAPPLSPQAFAEQTAGFGEQDWADLQLAFVPALDGASVRHDLAALWRALENDEVERFDAALAARSGCVVWREGFRAVFKLVDLDEWRALEMMRAGGRFGALCARLSEGARTPQEEERAAQRAGAMLAGWLAEGMIAALGRARPAA